jgi:hypothetical protein
MPSNELETIAASIQDALHRAYEMGRSDALRRVVQMVQQDELGSKTVALLGRSEPSVAETPHPESQKTEAQPIQLPHDENEADAGPSDATHDADAGHADTPRQEERVSAPPVSMKDFLKDFLYPLGGKK